MSRKKSSQQAAQASVRGRMRVWRSRTCLCCNCLRCVLLRYQCLHSYISSVTVLFVAFACVAAAFVFSVSVDVCMCGGAHVRSATVGRMNGQQHQRCHLASSIVCECACACVCVQVRSRS
jgi:hypothetical protein